jgi:hypothetical protein
MTAAAAAAFIPPAARGLSGVVVGALASLTSDVPFKRAFGRQETVDVLRALLNATMRPAAGGSAHEVAAINNVEVRATNARDVIYDIHCTLQSGTSVIVELQKAAMRDQIVDRLVGYQGVDYSRQWESGSETLASQLRLGPRPYGLVPVRVLALLDFCITRDRAQCGGLVQHYNVQPARGTDAAPAFAGRFHELSDFTVVQLPLAPGVDELAEATPAGKWAHLLHYSSRYRVDTLPVPLADGAYRKAAESARRDTLSRDELEALQRDEASAALFIDNDVARVAAEAACKAAEAACKTAEAALDTERAARETAEAARETAEAARETAEAAREAAEAKIAKLERAIREGKLF